MGASGGQRVARKAGGMIRAEPFQRHACGWRQEDLGGATGGDRDGDRVGVAIAPGLEVDRTARGVRDSLEVGQVAELGPQTASGEGGLEGT